MSHWMCIGALHRNKARTTLCFDSRSKIYDRSPAAIKPPLSQANPVTLPFYEQINFKHYYDSNRDRTHKIPTPLFIGRSLNIFTKYFTKTFLSSKRKKNKTITLSDFLCVLFCHVYTQHSWLINYIKLLWFSFHTGLLRFIVISFYFYDVLLKYFNILCNICCNYSIRWHASVKKHLYLNVLLFHVAHFIYYMTNIFDLAT